MNQKQFGTCFLLILFFIGFFIPPINADPVLAENIFSSTLENDLTSKLTIDPNKTILKNR